ncbi:MAG: hypothetical protein KJO53_00660 [Eudoraea sp.]|nr:hypothetical protein [Eudoraea sp.]
MTIPPTPDTDAIKCGYSNTLENVTIENFDRAIQFVSYTNIGGTFSAPVTNNVFVGMNLISYGTIGVLYNDSCGNEIIDSSFKNDNSGIITAKGKPNNVTFLNCTY